jgi:hypothetical protein
MWKSKVMAAMRVRSVVNAASPADLDVFVAGLLLAESEGRRFLFRTAAQFVAARLGLEPPPLWPPDHKPGERNAANPNSSRRPRW